MAKKKWYDEQGDLWLLTERTKTVLIFLHNDRVWQMSPAMADMLGIAPYGKKVPFKFYSSKTP